MTGSELEDAGFQHVHPTAKVSRLASFHGSDRVVIGAQTRIDDFCVISAGEGGIVLGRNVHLSVYVSIQGAGKVTVSDFATVSSRVAIYSSNDDYSGRSLTNPTVPSRLRGVSSDNVVVQRHAIVGAGSIILPGVDIGEGAVIGALSLVKEACDPFVVYGGVPARPIGKRKRDLLTLEGDPDLQSA